MMSYLQGLRNAIRYVEEYIFSERWFEQSGFPDGLKMWVLILKNDKLD